MGGTTANHPAPLRLLLPFLALTILLHAYTFSLPHDEGDEVVYMVLASAMSWDLSHYTTRDDPIVSQYPYSSYRVPVFPHPPLFPLILKAGLAIGVPVAVGLLAQLAAMFLLLVFARRTARGLGVSTTLQAALYSGLTLGPLLLFSTTRLHTDGLLAILLFCAITMQVEATSDRSLRKAALAGLFFVLALNVRYNALAALALIPMIQAFHLHRGGWHLRGFAQWKCAALISLLIVAFGLPHYYRILATYGSLIPSAFIVADPDVQRWNAYLSAVHSRTRPQTALALVGVFPMLLTWFSASTWRELVLGLQRGSWAPIYPAAAVLLITIQMLFMHGQLRYFAVATPFLLTTFVLQISAAHGVARRRLWWWAAVTLFSMTVSGLEATFVRPDAADVYPGIFFLFLLLNKTVALASWPVLTSPIA